MSAARSRAARPSSLVLVRGGLDARDGGGDDDWEDFCRRIGWQTAAPEPDADFEERLAAGIAAESSAPDNVVELDFERSIRRSLVRRIGAPREEEPPISGVRDVERPAEDAAEASFAPVGEAGDARRGWRRARAAVLTLALAAAALLAITRLVSSSARAPAASIAAPSSEVTRAVTARPQVDAPPPRDVDPLRASPRPAPTSKPAPSTPRPAPKGPGRSRDTTSGEPVARRSLEAPSSGHALAEARPAVARLDAPFAYRRAAWRGAGAQADLAWGAAARPRVALSAAEGLPPIHGRAGAGVWSSASAVEPASRAATTDASWSLSGAKDRWVGASLSPASPSLAQANIGVMVQIDVGKALGKL